jgi:hypothetical protein
MKKKLLLAIAVVFVLGIAAAPRLPYDLTRQLVNYLTTTPHTWTATQKFGSETSYSYFESDGTLVAYGNATTWDDIRILPGSFDRPGISDPAMVPYVFSGTTTYLWEFGKDDIASFTLQMPHGHAGTSIYAHVHWTPGNRGNEESGATVGWKVDWTWADKNGAFGAMQTADLQDVCDGTDHKHQISPEVIIGSGAGKGLSSMILCNIKRTDTGTDDAWASASSGELPFLLEIDFHYEINTFGSRGISTK